VTVNYRIPGSDRVLTVEDDNTEFWDARLPREDGSRADTGDDPLAADPIGGKPPIDVAQERAAEEGEPPGYVDPASQEVPDNYAPDPADVENPPAREPKPSAKRAGVTRADAKGGDNA
jgi:hypothetical protein